MGSTGQPSGRPAAENSYPANSKRWIVVPTPRKRRGHQFPIEVFRIVKEVIQDVEWSPVRINAIHQEILDRLEQAHPDYHPEPDAFSLDVLADIVSSINHPNFLRQPWGYNKFDDEGDVSSTSSEDSDDTVVPQPGPAPHNPNGTAPDNASPHDVVDLVTPEPPSNRDLSSTDSDASSDPEPKDGPIKLLKATWDFLKLQFEELLLREEARRREKAKKRVAQRAAQRAAQRDGHNAAQPVNLDPESDPEPEPSRHLRKRAQRDGNSSAQPVNLDPESDPKPEPEPSGKRDSDGTWSRNAGTPPTSEPLSENSSRTTETSQSPETRRTEPSPSGIQSEEDDLDYLFKE